MTCVRLGSVLGWLACSMLAMGCANNNGAPCDPACPGTTQTCCDGRCVFLTSDPLDCGMCGNSCAAGQVCVSGVCAASTTDAGNDMCFPGCTDTQRCCGSICVNEEQPRGSDGRPANPDDAISAFNNCNGCGIECDPERSISCSVPSGGTAMSRPACLCGDLPQCLSGELCVLEGTLYTCISTSTDVNNCGGVGIMCADGERCDGGNCVCGSTGGQCGAGEGCCGGACIDLQTNAAHCGACNNACGAQGPDCAGGQCRCGTSPACDPPMAGTLFPPSAGDPGASCCTGACVPNTATSCGGCGVMCTDDDECVVSAGLPLPGGPMGAAMACCGQEIPLLGAICTGGLLPDGGFGLPDAGFGLPDAGIPFDAGM